MRIAYLADHAEHVPELARLHFAEWGCLKPGESLAGRTARLRTCCGRRAVPCAVIALEGAELSGSAMLVAHDMESHPHLGPWLAGVYVKPGHRRRGIASLLVARIEAEARSLGIQELYLYTENAESLYARLGWSAMERCQYRGAGVVVMSKALGSQPSLDT